MAMATVRTGVPNGADPLEPPNDEIPDRVPVERIVARSDDVVISVGNVMLYSSGVLTTFFVRFGPRITLGTADREELQRTIRVIARTHHTASCSV